MALAKKSFIYLGLGIFNKQIIHHPQRISPFQFAREAEYFHIVLSGSLKSVLNHDVISIKTACNLRQNTP